MYDNEARLPFFVSKEEYAQMVGCWHSIRRVLVSDDLNEEMLTHTRLELLKLDFVNNEPITLIIQSGGGTVIPTYQLEDVIQGLNSPVDALVMGDCASMAVDLLQMCRRRLMLPSARLLIHYIRYRQRWICDDFDQLDIDFKYFRERNEEIAMRRLDLYMKRTGLPREKITEIFRHGEIHEAYFSAQQALKLCLVDEIVTDFKFFPRKN